MRRAVSMFFTRSRAAAFGRRRRRWLRAAASGRPRRGAYFLIGRDLEAFSASRFELRYRGG
jgi:hypothetical protein